mmetsp:Transcript_81076/g.229615  ORF Transcript_81076/g.229615 Transcript_81076/m.229615 type:complete len:345 (-) Transcript_81076:342-1376(-)
MREDDGFGILAHSDSHDLTVGPESRSHVPQAKAVRGRRGQCKVPALLQPLCRMLERCGLSGQQAQDKGPVLAQRCSRRAQRRTRATAAGLGNQLTILAQLWRSRGQGLATQRRSLQHKRTVSLQLSRGLSERGPAVLDRLQYEGTVCPESSTGVPQRLATAGHDRGDEQVTVSANLVGRAGQDSPVLQHGDAPVGVAPALDVHREATCSRPVGLQHSILRGRAEHASSDGCGGPQRGAGLLLGVLVPAQAPGQGHAVLLVDHALLAIREVVAEAVLLPQLLGGLVLGQERRLGPGQEEKALNVQEARSKHEFKQHVLVDRHILGVPRTHPTLLEIVGLQRSLDL